MLLHMLISVCSYSAHFLMICCLGIWLLCACAAVTVLGLPTLHSVALLQCAMSLDAMSMIVDLVARMLAPHAWNWRSMQVLIEFTEQEYL